MAEKGVEEQVLAMERLHYNSIKSRNFNVWWNLPLHWNLKFQVSKTSQKAGANSWKNNPLAAHFCS